MSRFEDVAIGSRLDLGAYLFTEEDIVTFARQFDPQRFHLSEEEAARTHFGRLCASGWHTASIWMKLMIETLEREAAEKRAHGEEPGLFGPSPGFEAMRWPRPVFAGDTVRYSCTITDKRASRSRPGWGLLIQHNEGVNQNGEAVFAFTGKVFMARRDAATTD